jgi:hypothetical protein
LYLWLYDKNSCVSKNVFLIAAAAAGN